MASLDLSTAIQNFDPKKHNYLAVKKEKGSVSLTVSHKTRFGRLWMAMGISNASMTRVLKYLIKQSKTNSESLTSLSDANKSKLLQRVEKFAKKHKHWCKKHQIANLINQLKPSTAPVKPEEKPSRSDKGDKGSGGAQQGGAGSSKDSSKQQKDPSGKSNTPNPAPSPQTSSSPLASKQQQPAPTMHSSGTANASQPAVSATTATKVSPVQQPSLAPAAHNSTSSASAPQQPTVPKPAPVLPAPQPPAVLNPTMATPPKPQPVPAPVQPKPGATAVDSSPQPPALPKPVTITPSEPAKLAEPEKLDYPLDAQLSKQDKLLNPQQLQKAPDVLSRTRWSFFESRETPRAYLESNLGKVFTNALLQRKAYLDQEYSLSKLCKELSSNEKDVLTAEDLDLPYEQSAFKIMLMPKEEFLALRIDDIEKLSARQMEAFNKRAKILNNEISKAVFYSFMNSLGAEGILNLQARRLPAILWSYISETALQNIPVARFNDQVIELLFINSDCNHREKMTVDQLNKAFVPYLQKKDRLFLIPGSRLNDVVYTKELFHAVFPALDVKNLSFDSYQKSFAHLTVPIIEKNLDYMDAARMAYLSDEQIGKLNAAKLSEAHLEALHKAKKIGKLNKDQLTACWSKFNEVSIEGLTRVQLTWLDPSAHPFNEDLFEARFPQVDVHIQQYYKEDFAGLKKEMVAHLFPFMDAARILYMSDDQIRDLDSNLLTTELLNVLAQADKISTLKFDQVTANWEEFSAKSVAKLSYDQLKQLDPEKHRFDQSFFDALFPIEKDYMLELVKRKFALLSQPMVHHLLPFMSGERLAYFSDQQFRDLDTAHLNRNHIKDLAKARKIPLFSETQVKQCWEKFDEEIKFLSEPQLSKLNPTDNPFSRLLLEKLFPLPAQNFREGMRDTCAPKFHQLSSPMVNYLLQFMGPEQMIYLSVSQVRELDPKRMQKQHIVGLCLEVKKGEARSVVHLKNEQIAACSSLFDNESVDSLTDDQLASLDTAKITGPQFDEIFRAGVKFDADNENRFKRFNTEKQIDGMKEHIQRRGDLHKLLSKNQKEWAKAKSFWGL